MDIDFSRTITALDGTEIKESKDSDKPLTLGKVAIEALLGTLLDERGAPERLSGEAKVRNAKLATDIYAANMPLRVKSEDITLIKGRIGFAWDAITVMRAYALLEGD